MKKLKVFYTPRQNVAKNKSFSPSAGKPRKVVESWKKTGWIDIIEAKPLLQAEISLAHDSYYVDQVMACKMENGFGNKSPEIAESLFYTTGSFLQAAVYAFVHKTVAISPTSGFHHACFDSGGGFCTFNGLMIAARRLLHAPAYGIPAAKKIGILDLDAHYGNGTDNIIKELKLEKKIVHVTSVRTLKDIQASLKKFRNCDIILYQAGADPHENDPIGGGSFTSEELRQRDRIIFEYAKRHDKPIAWNLAGGYQTPIKKVIDIHMATLEECYKVYGDKK